jgi:hypothetical protein
VLGTAFVVHAFAKPEHRQSIYCWMFSVCVWALNSYRVWVRVCSLQFDFYPDADGDEDDGGDPDQQLAAFWQLTCSTVACD